MPAPPRPPRPPLAAPASPADVPASPSPQLATPAPRVRRTVTARAPLRLATSAANAEILTGLREAVRCQVASYVRAAREGPFTSSQATALHKLALTYQLLAAGTDAELARYDVAGLTDGELAAALAQAGGGAEDVPT